MVTDLLQHPLHQFARVFEGSQNFLGVAQPVRVNLEHGVEVLHVSQVLFNLPLSKTSTQPLIRSLGKKVIRLSQQIGDFTEDARTYSKYQVGSVMSHRVNE